MPDLTTQLSYFLTRLYNGTWAAGALGDGAVGTPALSFASDSDTGFWSGGSGTTNWSANGAQVLAFSTNGISVSGTNAGLRSNALGTRITFGAADAQVNLLANGLAAGVGLDFLTDAVLKVRTRAHTGDASLSALHLVLSGTITTADGTALVPAIGFASEPALGFWRPSAGLLRTEGAMTVLGNFVSGGSLTSGGGSNIGWASRSTLTSPANGTLNMAMAGGTVGVGFDVATDAVFKVRTRAQSAYAQVDALGYSVGGVAGASKTAGAVTSITVVNGIVTAIS